MIKRFAIQIRSFFAENGIRVPLFLLAAALLWLVPEFLNFASFRWFRPRAAISFLLSFSAFLLLAYYLRTILAKVIAFLFLALVSVNMGLLTACLYLWQSDFTVSEFLALTHTSPGEIRTMAPAIMPYVGVALSFFIIACTLLVWGHRVIRAAKRREIVKRVGFITLTLTLCITLIGCPILSLLHRDSRTAERVWHTTPLYFFAAVNEGINIQIRLRQVQKYSSTIQAPTVLPNSTRNVVIILGESARRDALSLYGQQYATTPIIDAQIDNLLIYDSAVACAPHTLYAIPPMLCSALPSTSFNPRDMANNVIHLANLSNIWTTYWISNQGKYGVHDSENGIIAGFSKRQHWMLPTYQHDGVLLPFLDSALHDDSPKRLIFIHLAGSHTPAHDRFPKQFARFTLADQELADYLNSVLYTDYIIGEIYHRLEDSPSIVIYLSDHGQSRINGHFLHHWSKKGVDVPLFIWHSQSVDSTFKRHGHIQQPTSTSDLFELLKFYLGIQTLDRKPDNTDLTVCEPDNATTYRQLPEGN